MTNMVNSCNSGAQYNPSGISGSGSVAAGGTGVFYFQPGAPAVSTRFDAGETACTCPFCGSPASRIGSSRFSMICDGSLSGPTTGSRQHQFDWPTSDGGWQGLPEGAQNLGAPAVIDDGVRRLPGTGS